MDNKKQLLRMVAFQLAHDAHFGVLDFDLLLVLVMHHLLLVELFPKMNLHFMIQVPILMLTQALFKLIIHHLMRSKVVFFKKYFPISCYSVGSREFL